MEELKINQEFDRIQKFIQNVIADDAFIMRIIVDSAIQKDDKAVLEQQRGMKAYKYN